MATDMQIRVRRHNKYFWKTGYFQGQKKLKPRQHQRRFIILLIKIPIKSLKKQKDKSMWKEF